MSNKPSMLSIKELFTESQQYIIPIYQRNYAWELGHLRQLIQDIWDNCLQTPERNYYIGTLVVYKTREGLETIDGQQRLTTLNIILCAMRNEMEMADSPYDWFKGVNLAFEFRKSASDALKNIYSHIDPLNIGDDTIKRMYEQVKPTMETVLGRNMANDGSRFTEYFDKFKNYFFNKVIITRVPLPNDMDLNHYFEIMNTRGEQLEKHEILKALIFSPLKNDPKALWLANLIWNACADMNRYVQLGIRNTELRRTFFSDNLNTLACDSFDDLLTTARQHAVEENQSRLSILEIDRNGKTGDVTGNNVTINSDDDGSRFNSVINFPNFLLQTLRVITREDIPLDDKRLLETFTSRNMDVQFAKNFLYKLLKLRLLFDTYIIKRDYVDETENGKWNILKLEAHDKSFIYNNSFEKSQKKNIMIQAMFHVSLPSQNYKHWLCGALSYLFDHEDGNGLYDYLNTLSHAYMLDRILQPADSQLNYYDIIFTNHGNPKCQLPKTLSLPGFDANIDIFYFNYLDMQLWLDGKEPDFTFSARSSIEHFYPQHPMENFEPMDEAYLHNFGNLCLIDRSKNSRLSNFSPRQKVDFYKNSAIDSIKQKIMMDICKKRGSWTTAEVDAHANEMRQILITSLSG